MFWSGNFPFSHFPDPDMLWRKTLTQNWRKVEELKLVLLCESGLLSLNIQFNLCFWNMYLIECRHSWLSEVSRSIQIRVMWLSPLWVFALTERDELVFFTSASGRASKGSNKCLKRKIVTLSKSKDLDTPFGSRASSFSSLVPQSVMEFVCRHQLIENVWV